jgi:surfactin synthase thioesterase subunit
VPNEIYAALLGALLGALLTYRFAKRLADEQAAHARELLDSQAAHARALAENESIRHASYQLRAAFAPSLVIIRRAQRNLTTDIDAELVNAIPLLAAAIEQYRFFVPTSKRSAYQQAWDDYQEGAELGSFEPESNYIGLLHEKLISVISFSNT